MREIKFRAWDYEDKKMWKVVAISDCIWGDCEQTHIRICEFDKSPRDKDTDVRLSVTFKLMQYTGLKDKNGREIYEGDIVMQLSERTYDSLTGVVKFIDGSYVIETADGKNGGYLFDELVFNVLIGNIYENSELLEGIEYEK